MHVPKAYLIDRYNILVRISTDFLMSLLLCVWIHNERRDLQFKVDSEEPILRNFTWKFYFILKVFSFLQRKCYPLTRCIKNAADQRWSNVIFFIWENITQILKKGKGIPCVYHLWRSAARLLIFRLNFFNAFFNNQKQIF